MTEDNGTPIDEMTVADLVVLVAGNGGHEDLILQIDDLTFMLCCRIQEITPEMMADFHAKSDKRLN
jgi:hypothetical protein